MISYLLLWGVLVFVFLFVSNNLLFSLLVLELLALVFILLFSSLLNYSIASDFFLFLYFSFFVLEGVVGVFGFILLVFFSGCDYVGSFTSLNF